MTTPTPSTRRVVLCADDYALSAAVSHGIATLAEAGRLSATSAMVLSPRWREDAARLAPLRGRIDVGLHLDWTSDFAREAGHGLGLGAAMLRAALAGLRGPAVRAVIERQLDLFEAAWGAAPDHIDGHQHVQQFAGVREHLLAAMERRYRGAERPYLRVSRAPAGQADLKARIIAAWGANGLARQAASAGFACSPALSGIYGFEVAEGRYATLMQGWLHQVPDGTLLMCHPALSADAGDAIGPARAAEYRYLASPAFGDALAAHGVTLARGRGLYTRAP